MSTGYALFLIPFTPVQFLGIHCVCCRNRPRQLPKLSRVVLPLLHICYIIRPLVRTWKCKCNLDYYYLSSHDYLR